ncbi:MAG: hypothetical protein ACYC1L_06220 [Alphaproteobacteria bacterium]
MTNAVDGTKPRRQTQWTKNLRPASPNPWTKKNAPGGVYGTRALQRAFEGRAGDKAVQKLFRRKSIPVVHALSQIIADKKAPASVRVAAAQLFLERGWGKIEADGAAPKRAKKKDGPIVVVNTVPRSPYKNSGGI